MIRTMCLAGAFALLASGCASLSESQCVAGDWQTVGYTDGAAGKPSSQLLKHQNACVKHGVVPDRNGYLAGWDDGIEIFCQPQNGFNQGERGAGFTNVCPNHLKHAYNDAYQQGRTLYQARAEISRLQSARNAKKRRLDTLADEIAATESQLIHGDLTPVERYELIDETKALAQEQGQLEQEIEQLTAEIAVKQDRLEDLSVSLAYGY